MDQKIGTLFHFDSSSLQSIKRLQLTHSSHSFFGDLPKIRLYKASDREAFNAANIANGFPTFALCPLMNEALEQVETHMQPTPAKPAANEKSKVVAETTPDAPKSKPARRTIHQADKKDTPEEALFKHLMRCRFRVQTIFLMQERVLTRQIPSTEVYLQEVSENMEKLPLEMIQKSKFIKVLRLTLKKHKDQNETKFPSSIKKLCKQVMDQLIKRQSELMEADA